MSENQNNSNQSKMSKRNETYFAILMIGLALTGIVTYFVMTRNPTSENSSTTTITSTSRDSACNEYLFFNYQSTLQQQFSLRYEVEKSEDNKQRLKTLNPDNRVSFVWFDNLIAPVVFAPICDNYIIDVRYAKSIDYFDQMILGMRQERDQENAKNKMINKVIEAYSHPEARIVEDEDKQ